MSFEKVQKATNPENKNGPSITEQSVFLLRTHKWNDLIQSTYQALQRDFGAENVYVLMDATNVSLSSSSTSTSTNNVKIPDLDPTRWIKTTEKDCQKHNGLHDDCYMHVDAQLMIWFETYLASQKNNMPQSNKKYAWLIEYDVVCAGNRWKECLQQQTVHLDFGATFVEPYDAKINGGWYWWNAANWSLAPTESLPAHASRLIKIPKQACWKSFFPITLFSFEFLTRFQAKYYGKITSFCEILFPTVCNWEDGLIAGCLAPQMIGPIFRADHPLSPKQLPHQKNTPPQLFHPVRLA
jgi:hypothetical protein